MATEVKPKSRLLSLDVFRGATMAAMILVNDPGDWSHIYPFLDHSEWNGCTPTDLIFPFFLFMVGVSIVFSMESKKEVSQEHSNLIWHAFKRMINLILINYGIHFVFRFLAGDFNIIHIIQGLRLPGVLPRIAVVYFICTVIYLKTTAKIRVWIFAGCLIGYYLIMTLIPVPGVGYANLNPTTNLGAWLDRLVFGTNHLWVESKVWDPEGLLGTIPAIATGLFGIRVGTWLKSKDEDIATKITWMLVYGVGAVVLALFWDLFFPINKKLWTSSFVLYTGGLATITLGVLYWLVDVKGYKRATPIFVAFGINSITAYILSDLIPGLFNTIKTTYQGQPTDLWGLIYRSVFVPNFTPINASLGSAILLVVIIWVIMWVLYKRKIIIKV